MSAGRSSRIGSSPTVSELLETFGSHADQVVDLGGWLLVNAFGAAFLAETSDGYDKGRLLSVFGGLSLFQNITDDSGLMVGGEFIIAQEVIITGIIRWYPFLEPVPVLENIQAIYVMSMDSSEKKEYRIGLNE